MNIDTALRVFKEDTEKLCTNENIPVLFRSKKLDVHNVIIEHISDLEMQNEELQFQLNKANEFNNNITYKYECILLSIGIKATYLGKIPLTPVSHFEFLLNKAISLKYFNKFNPEDLYIGALYKHKEQIDLNFEALFKDKVKFKNLSSKEIINHIESIDHE